MESFKLCLLIYVFGQLAYGIPLEEPSDDFERFFTPRIVGGDNAPKAYAPHMAALVVGTQFKTLNCGGSIVSPNLILSAAHCIDIFVVWGKLIPYFYAVVGSNNWDSGGLTVHFRDFHIHPGWNITEVENDIGFLVPEKTLSMSERVAVIGLNFKWVGEREISYVTGWGRLTNGGIIPYKLQILYVKTISHEECVERVQEASALLNRWAPPVKPGKEICTFHSVGHGMCNGDSGSALVSTRTDKQIGIVSWGFPCAVGAPDVFVRISGYKCFIKKIMKKYL